MPARDGRGPQGVGPMTGWGMGNCVVPNPKDSQGGPQAAQAPYFGRGLGMGLGRGRGQGFGRGLGLGARAQGGYPQQVPVSGQELETLKMQAEMLKQQMDVVQHDIKHLEAEKKSKG